MSGVVVTGVGLVTSVGVGADAAWKAMLAGREGAGEIPYFDTSAYKVHRAHVIREVGLDTTPHELACMAACEAVRDAGLDVARTGPERVGVVIGTLGGDLKTFEGALRGDPQRKANGFTSAVARTYPLSTILGALADRLGTGGPPPPPLDPRSPPDPPPPPPRGPIPPGGAGAVGVGRGGRVSRARV